MQGISASQEAFRAAPPRPHRVTALSRSPGPSRACPRQASRLSAAPSSARAHGVHLVHRGHERPVHALVTLYHVIRAEAPCPELREHVRQRLLHESELSQFWILGRWPFSYREALPFTRLHQQNRSNQSASTTSLWHRRAAFRGHEGGSLQPWLQRAPHFWNR